MIEQIILITYVVLASTIGAWWLASNDIHKKEITLFDIIGNIVPSIMFIWFFYPLYVLDKIKFKKLKNTKIKKLNQQQRLKRLLLNTLK